jgi:ElaB/YqjD/DUF883 family membrane-anchored ribosome-binding protein
MGEMAGIRETPPSFGARRVLSSNNWGTRGSQMTLEETANSSVHSAIDQGRQAADKASQAVKDGYDAAQQYVKDKAGDLDLRDLVRREPWLAIAAAFAVGYVVAQIVRRVS